MQSTLVTGALMSRHVGLVTQFLYLPCQHYICPTHTEFLESALVFIWSSLSSAELKCSYISSAECLQMNHNQIMHRLEITTVIIHLQFCSNDTYALWYCWVL